jgi:hypothetical protein
VEPRENLAGQLSTLAAAEGIDVNVYDAPPAILAVPALVVRFDTPFRQPNSRQELAFGEVGERYAAVAIVQAGGGDTASLLDTLRALALLAESVGTPWRWTETSGIAQASEGGIDYLAVTCRLTYMEG